MTSKAREDTSQDSKGSLRVHPCGFTVGPRVPGTVLGPDSRLSQVWRGPGRGQKLVLKSK